jgi:DNA polymerase IV (DinB-like DNA polymerase)
MEILQTYADKFERWGLDEAFLDVTSKVQDFKGATKLAERIKREIYRKERLTCSIGVGPNKLVAKIASDFNKPDGLTVVTKDDVKRFLAPLPVQRLLWVGKKTTRRLNEIGIKTIGDLATFNVSTLVDKFGAMGEQYHRFAHGIDHSEVAERGEIQSIGREITFEADTNEYDVVLKRLDKLGQRVHNNLMDHQLLFKTVTVKIRYANFETHTHGKTLRALTNRLEDLQKTARKLAQPYFREGRKIRLIGVRVANLTSSREQKTLV